jgi:hypothetical protein
MNVELILSWSIMAAFLLALIDAAVLFWVALFRLEQIESSFGNSKINAQIRQLGNNVGLIGRQYRLSKAISVLLFPNMYVRKGLVDPNDLKNMPPHLKRLVLIPTVSGVLLLVLLFMWALMTGRF